MSTSAIPTSATVPTLSTLPELRQWRQQAFKQDKSVGIVPTMGALHEGHLSLVRYSLKNNPFTVLTLFVNPTQFAPHEDLASYPRTLASDLKLLEKLIAEHRGELKEENPIIVWTPQRETMYPLSELLNRSGTAVNALQDVSKQRGAFVEVKGWGDVLEGASRPQFFRGVATVCTKLFNAVQPNHAYFGQKDIQQALLLQTMLKDLLTAHPSHDNLHIIPTTRDLTDGLALSSRNVYLTAKERAVAPKLYQILKQVKQSAESSSSSNPMLGSHLRSHAEAQIVEFANSLPVDQKDVQIKFDYLQIYDRDTFEPITGPIEKGRKAVAAAAMWVGKTRLIDNVLIGWDLPECERL